MRYYLKIIGDIVVAYKISEKNFIAEGFEEVDLFYFKAKLSEIGIEYLTQEEKTEKLEEENLTKTEEITDLDYRLANIELGL